MEWNSQISVEKSSFYRGRKYFLTRVFTGNTVNSCHIIKMTGNSFGIFRKDKSQCQTGIKLLQGFSFLIWMRTWGFITKGENWKLNWLPCSCWEKTSTSVSGLLPKNPFSWSFGLKVNWFVFVGPFLPSSHKTNLSCRPDGLCSEFLVHVAGILCIILLTYPSWRIQSRLCLGKSLSFLF